MGRSYLSPNPCANKFVGRIKKMTNDNITNPIVLTFINLLPHNYRNKYPIWDGLLLSLISSQIPPLKNGFCDHDFHRGL